MSKLVRHFLSKWWIDFCRIILQILDEQTLCKIGGGLILRQVVASVALFDAPGFASVALFYVPVL